VKLEYLKVLDHKYHESGQQVCQLEPHQEQLQAWE